MQQERQIGVEHGIYIVPPGEVEGNGERGEAFQWVLDL